jgi:hypothetical protein
VSADLVRIVLTDSKDADADKLVLESRRFKVLLKSFRELVG